jgi:glycosyltransferase involved in cell wall biosynthesis
MPNRNFCGYSNSLLNDRKYCTNTIKANRMQKLLIASTCLPPRVGGRERAVWELSKRLAHSFQVHIVTTEGGTVEGERLNVDIRYVPKLPLLTLAYSGPARHILKKVLNDLLPDIIHSHAALPWGYVFRNERQKKVITCHGSEVYARKRQPMRLLLTSAFNKADRITVPSRWLQRYMQEHYGSKPVLIPNGVDTRMFRPNRNVRAANNVVLFVGRFLKHKGIFDLIEAARILPEYEFWLAGESRTKSIEFPRLPNVKVLGTLTHPELAFHYTRASVIVFPSHAENFPMAGLEAMSCGKPIVATKLGFSEYVEHGRDGLLIEPRDVKALVSTIQYVLKNNKEKRRLGENARRKALRYDWSRITEKYVELYRSL